MSCDRQKIRDGLPWAAAMLLALGIYQTSAAQFPEPPLASAFGPLDWDVAGAAAIDDVRVQIRGLRLQTSPEELAQQIRLGQRLEFGPDLTTDTQDPIVLLRLIRQREALPPNPYDSRARLVSTAVRCRP
ncbi:MAG: hypothetical protein AAGF97_02450 [Planctomycetota bacterium]